MASRCGGPVVPSGTFGLWVCERCGDRFWRGDNVGPTTCGRARKARAARWEAERPSGCDLLDLFETHEVYGPVKGEDEAYGDWCERFALEAEDG